VFSVEEVVFLPLRSVLQAEIKAGAYQAMLADATHPMSGPFLHGLLWPLHLLRTVLRGLHHPCAAGCCAAGACCRTRSGDVVRLVELLDEAKQRITDTIKKRWEDGAVTVGRASAGMRVIRGAQGSLTDWLSG
jgi:hypothetical protein